MPTQVPTSPAAPLDGDNAAVTVRTMAPLGASQDLLLRMFATMLKDRFGTIVVVENKPGRDGVVAAQITRTEAADGRHLLMSGSATLTFYPHVEDVGYVEADFEPLLGVGRYNFVVVTRVDSRWATLHDLFIDARAAGRTIRYAGSGRPDFLLVQTMATRTGAAVEFLQLNGPALLDAVLSGAADIGLGTGTHQTLLDEGRLRITARLHPRANPGNGTPCPMDFGIDATLDTFIVFAAPRDVDPDRKLEIVSMLRQVAEQPETTAFLRERLAMLPIVLAGEELAVALRNQRRDFARLQRLAG